MRLISIYIHIYVLFLCVCVFVFVFLSALNVFPKTKVLLSKQRIMRSVPVDTVMLADGSASAKHKDLLSLMMIKKRKFVFGNKELIKERKLEPRFFEKLVLDKHCRIVAVARVDTMC